MILWPASRAPVIVSIAFIDGMKHILFSLSALFFAAAAHAQMGWTIKECNAKFGEGTPHEDLVYYQVGHTGLELAVLFSDQDGRATEVVYSSEQPLAPNTIKLLLKENAPGYVWIKQSDDEWAAWTPDKTVKSLDAYTRFNHGRYFLDIIKR